MTDDDDDDVRKLFQAKRKLRHPDPDVQEEAMVELYFIAKRAKHPAVHRDAVDAMAEVNGRDLVVSESRDAFDVRVRMPEAAVRVGRAAAQ